MQNISFSYHKTNKDFEIIEHKGPGHPDSLSDGLANHLSHEYSDYTKKKFGLVLNHNFDKVGLLGGESLVDFGNGEVTKPIRVLINGRASVAFEDEEIPLYELLKKWGKEYLLKMLPLLNPDTDLEFHNNLSTASSPGRTKTSIQKGGTRASWFHPKDKKDLYEFSDIVANDTSLGVGFAPFSKLENFVLRISDKLSDKKTKLENQWLGSDFKVMAIRDKESVFLTLCIPQIANYVKDLDDYENNLNTARKIILALAEDQGIHDIHLSINTRDKKDICELYLTAVGSSIETGDEGLVGRGNRIGGLITPMRPMSMEGSAGKNPVNHIGKVYYEASMKLSQEIYNQTGIANSVYMVSQSGRTLNEPWKLHISLECNPSPEVEETLSIIAKSICLKMMETAHAMTGKS